VNVRVTLILKTRDILSINFYFTSKSIIMYNLLKIIFLEGVIQRKTDMSGME
jgi:hypothetical protein